MALHFVSHGDGVPVLALHGWSPDHRLMTGCLEPIFGELTGYRRLYPDLPAMGRSPAGDIDSSDGIMAALREFIDEQIGDEPFLLLGESYGGYLARGLVAERPEQIRGLAMICPVGELWHKNRKLPEHVVLRTEPGVLESLEEGEDFTELAVVQSAAALAAYRSDVAPGLALADEAAMERVQQNWALTIAPESGPPYVGPALILCGRQDAVTGFEDQFTLIPHYPRATYAVVDVAGHNLQIEQPELLRAFVREWLLRVG